MSIFILFVILQNPETGQWDWIPGGEYKTLAECESAGNFRSENWMCGELVPRDEE